jgi:hypothetical protein
VAEQRPNITTPEDRRAAIARVRRFFRVPRLGSKMGPATLCLVPLKLSQLRASRLWQPFPTKRVSGP